MNARPLTKDDLGDAREETRQLLAVAEHYCRLARGHLEVDDDIVAIWDITAAQEHFRSAIRAFEPVRASFRQRVNKAENAA